MTTEELLTNLASRNEEFCVYFFPPDTWRVSFKNPTECVLIGEVPGVQEIEDTILNRALVSLITSLP